MKSGQQERIIAPIVPSADESCTREWLFLIHDARYTPLGSIRIFPSLLKRPVNLGIAGLFLPEVTGMMIVLEIRRLSANADRNK